jgi:epoxyqueuosine reductase
MALHLSVSAKIALTENNMDEKEAQSFIETEIKDFTATSLINRMPDDTQQHIFDTPLIGYAAASDPLFTAYKTIIAETHLTPEEALALSLNKKTEELPENLTVISWILPITFKTRISNRAEKETPSRLWANTRWYGEKFNDALRNRVVKVLRNKGYLATAPAIQPYFKTVTNEKGPYSNWSERHVAYAAGLGTFSLSDGFITEKGIAHRGGSVVTDMALPVSYRKAKTAFSNCLFYADGSCKKCIARCPAGAITEAGHDKIKCQDYAYRKLLYLREEYQVGNPGCGLCQVKVPCEFRNPVKKKSPTA